MNPSNKQNILDFEKIVQMPKINYFKNKSNGECFKYFEFSKNLTEESQDSFLVNDKIKNGRLSTSNINSIFRKQNSHRASDSFFSYITQKKQDDGMTSQNEEIYIPEEF